MTTTDTDFGRIVLSLPGIWLFAASVFAFQPVHGEVAPRVLVDEADSIALLQGAAAVASPVRSGAHSAFLEGAERGQTFTFVPGDSDWSAYNTLSFRLHSARANDAQIFLVVNSRSDPEVFSYFYRKLTIDWEGWREVAIPFNAFGSSRSPVGWNQVDNLMFYFQGWNIRPKEDTVVHLDALSLENRPLPPPPGLTGAGEFEKQVYEAHYKANIEKNYVRYYGGMSFEAIKADETATRYEIDPAEFERNLAEKQSALEQLRARRIAEHRDRPLDSRDREALDTYIAALDHAERFRNLANVSQLLAVTRACVQLPEYRDNTDLRLRLYRSATASLQSVLDAPAWPSSCFGQPYQAAALYYTLHDRIEADKGDSLTADAAGEFERACRDVVYLAWVFPHSHNSGMRLKHPYSVNTFRYSTAYTVGNFGYRYVVDCALIHRDTKMLDIVKRVVLLSLRNVTSYNTHADTFWFNQGFMADGTGTAHGRQSYAFGYVDDYVSGGAFRNASLLKGTPWEIGTDHWDLVANFLLEGEQWIVYRGRIDYSVNGRHNLYAPEQRRLNYIFRGDRTVKGFAETVLELSEGQVAQRADLEAMIARLDSGGDLEGNRYWWCTEDLIQRRKGFYFLTNLSSVRIAGPENARPFAEKNAYFGDGATMILSDGSEYDHARGAWNMSALPGITAADKPVPYETTWIGFYGQNIYSGGVSDGRNGAAAFRYCRDGVPVKAQKAYFACDSTVAALGRITENDAGVPVLTTLNQTAWNTDVHYRAAGRDATVPRGETTTDVFRGTAAAAFWQDGIGYLVLPGTATTEVRLLCETRRTDWQSLAQIQKDAPNRDIDIFDLAVVHGDRDTFAEDRQNRETYQYVVQGNLAREEFAGFVDTPPVTVLANTATVQAVRFAARTIVQAAFYEAGTLRAEGVLLGVDRPAVVMIEERGGGEVAITVADPLQSPMTDAVEVTVGMALRGAGAATAQGQTVLTIAMPGRPFIGRSVTQIYRRQ